MTKIKSIFHVMYDNIWRNPKGKLTSRLKGACDAISPRRRLTAVSLMLTVFVLIAFFVFGHACYKIGLGHSGRLVNVEHIQPLEIHKPDVKPITTAAYDDAGMESED